MKSAWMAECRRRSAAGGRAGSLSEHIGEAAFACQLAVFLPWTHGVSIVRLVEIAT